MTSLGEPIDDDALFPREEGSAGVFEQEEQVICIKGPGFREQRSSALERFKRRVEEIARAAEIVCSHALPGPSAGEQRGERRGPICAGQRPRTLWPETFDSVPFGLKRRLAAGPSVFHGPECRRPADRNRVFRDDAQLQQIRRAIRRRALDLLTEMLEIDAGFREALAAHEDDRG